ncbi:MAG: DUF2752 domain-containing protein, partial [Clostridiales bacterium]|nr:DUF2752 domain-containing protein [Clostridiales bacterium]
FYKCPFKIIFKISCPGCGLTRAFINAAQFNFKAAFEFHPLFGMIFAELLYLLFRKQLLKRMKINSSFEIFILILTVVLMAAVYVIRLKLGILPA